LREKNSELDSKLTETLRLLKSTHESLVVKDAALVDNAAKNDELFRSLTNEHGTLSTHTHIEICDGWMIIQLVIDV
jgi:uncharacterized protein involved in exopolysaccharide biosynthesis